MDFFLMLILAVIIFLCGVISTLLVEFYLVKKYFESGPESKPPENPTKCYGKAELPDQLLESIDQLKEKTRGHFPSQGNENLAINLTLQFLFNELKNAERVRLWLYRKLNNEFKELLTQSTTRRVFDSVQVSLHQVDYLRKRLEYLDLQLRDLNLGSQFPTIKGLEVADAVIDKDTGLLETLDLALDLHYSGNFQMSIDVKMFRGRTANLSLQVKQITGKARLQFTRIPYTHWSLSFYTEPILELEVQSHFQGRQLKPQIVSPIISQIRRAIQRKHTLPQYKMRYKPFFRRLNDEDIDLAEVCAQLTPGQLDVVLVEVSRLNLAQSSLALEDLTLIEVYCTISVDSTPWVYLTQYNGVPYMVLDLIISKTSSHQLGVVFKQETIAEIGQNCVVVETIVSGSPAAIAEMRRGDILVSVDGKKVGNMNQVGKFVKNAAQRRFVIRVERKCTKNEEEATAHAPGPSQASAHAQGLFHTSKAKHEPLIKFSDLKDHHSDNETSSSGEGGIKLFRRRKSSVHVPEDSLEHLSRRISTISNVSSGSSTTWVDELTINDLTSMTKEKVYASTITFEESRTFQIESEFQYLNVGVWARLKGGDVAPKILGYLNVPIKLVLSQCSTSITGFYLKPHPLLPPDTASFALLNSKLQGYSGFDPSLCYGDILLSYRWTSSQTKRRNAGGDSAKREETKSSAVSAGGDAGEKKSHDFIRTHFHRATHCDFCSKKIWLKDAIQCRDCGMVCHKKCQARCQSSTSCGAESLTNLAFEVEELTGDGAPGSLLGDVNPEISLTGCEENVQGVAVKASAIANSLLGLKKAGSTSNLAPPSASGGSGSRSLPPSPCSSRKSSLVGGLGISPDLLEGAEPSVASPLVAGELNEGLMSHAKETGKFLYRDLEPNDRIDKINLMMGKLKAALDVESNSRLELSQSSDSDSAKLIAQSDLRVQALSVLLLHYCAGLQHAQEFKQSA